MNFYVSEGVAGHPLVIAQAAFVTYCVAGMPRFLVFCQVRRVAKLAFDSKIEALDRPAARTSHARRRRVLDDHFYRRIHLAYIGGCRFSRATGASRWLLNK